KGELKEFYVFLDEAGLPELAQLPGVPKPGGDGGVGFRREVRVVEALLQIGAPLANERVQPAELIERLTIDCFPARGRQFLAVSGIEELRVMPQRHLSAWQK